MSVESRALEPGCVSEDAVLTKELICENELLLLEVEQLRVFVMDNGPEKVHMLREENDRLRLQLNELEMRLNKKDDQRDVAIKLLIEQFNKIGSSLHVVNVDLVGLQKFIDESQQGEKEGNKNELKMNEKNDVCLKKINSPHQTVLKNEVKSAMEVELLSLREKHIHDQAILESMKKQVEEMQLELFFAREDIVNKNAKIIEINKREEHLQDEIEKLKTLLNTMEISLEQEKIKNNDLQNLYNNEVANVSELKDILKNTGAGISEADLQINKYKNMFQNSSFINSDNKYTFQQTMEVQDQIIAELRSKVCATNCELEDMKKYCKKQLDDAANEKKSLLFRIHELEKELRLANASPRLSARSSKRLP